MSKSLENYFLFPY